MKLLLDTHVFIWWDSDPAKLSKKALALCSDPGNLLLLSVASAWEMQIKMQLGKMQLAFPLQNIINEQRNLLCKKKGLGFQPLCACGCVSDFPATLRQKAKIGDLSYCNSFKTFICLQECQHFINIFHIFNNYCACLGIIKTLNTFA